MGLYINTVATGYGDAMNWCGIRDLNTKSALTIGECSDLRTDDCLKETKEFGTFREEESFSLESILTKN